MKKQVFLSLLLLSLSSFVFSEVEVGVNLGYGFGINGIKDDYILPDNEVEATVTTTDPIYYEKYKDVYTSLGNGIKIGIDGTFYLAEKLGVWAGFEFSCAGKTSTESVYDYIDLNYKSTINYEIVANYIAINVGLKLKADIDIFTPYIVVAPGLYIPVGVDGSEKTANNPGADTKDDFEIKYAPGFGVKGIIGAQIKLTDMISIRAECAPTFAAARLKEISVRDQDGDNTTYIFEKNEENLPPDANDKEYYHAGPKHVFNSFGINVGVVFGF